MSPSKKVVSLENINHIPASVMMLPNTLKVLQEEIDKGFEDAVDTMMTVSQVWRSAHYYTPALLDNEMQIVGYIWRLKHHKCLTILNVAMNRPNAYPLVGSNTYHKYQNIAQIQHFENPTLEDLRSLLRHETNTFVNKYLVIRDKDNAPVGQITADIFNGHRYRIVYKGTELRIAPCSKNEIEFSIVQYGVEDHLETVTMPHKGLFSECVSDKDDDGPVGLWDKLWTPKSQKGKKRYPTLEKVIWAQLHHLYKVATY